MEPIPVPSPPPEETPAVVVDPTKDIWQNIALNTRDPSAAGDVHLLLVGSPGAGKSTLLQRLFPSPTAGRAVRPTTALDYTFARRAERHVSQVAHLWELAQGAELSQLCEVVLTPECVHAVVVCVVVDCADPATMWETASYWLKRVDRRVGEILTKMRAKGSGTPEKMLTRAQRAMGADHPDLPRLRLCGVPIVLVCHKADAFAGDTAARKTLTRCMRFLAHLHGASLAITSEADTAKLRAWMHHLLFQVPLDPKHVQFDPERGAVLIPADKDTFADIGEPMVSDMGDFRSTGDGELDRWKAPFDSTFPPRKVEGRSQNDAFLKKLYDTGDGGFGEPVIDAIRKQKDDELEQYRKGSSKREKSAKEEKMNKSKSGGKDKDDV